PSRGVAVGGSAGRTKVAGITGVFGDCAWVPNSIPRLASGMSNQNSVRILRIDGPPARRNVSAVGYTRNARDGSIAVSGRSGHAENHRDTESTEKMRKHGKLKLEKLTQRRKDAKRVRMPIKSSLRLCAFA